MSSDLDPAKLKVVELRAELQTRGLDVKGNKPVLVKRLKEALEAELQKVIPDTSIADTSTEDLNSSQEADHDNKEEEEDNVDQDSPDPVQLEEQSVPKEEKPVKSTECLPDKTEEDKNMNETKVEVPSETEKPVATPETEKPVAIPETEKPVSVKDEIMDEAEEPAKSEDKKVLVEPKLEPVAEVKVEEKPTEADEVQSKESVEQQNGDCAAEDKDEDSDEPKNRKSRWGSNSEEEKKDVVEEAPKEESEAPQAEQQKMEVDNQVRAEKRKRTPSPDQPQQRRRSKSPNKDEEPAIDSSNVQLSWYDSDLHLQIDKETFLSAKPLHDGLFGYIWSGARLSHGIKSGKTFYEVKLTEELPFDDVLRTPNKEKKDRKSNDKRDKVAKNKNDDTKKDQESSTNTDTNKETDVAKECAADVPEKDGDVEMKDAAETTEPECVKDDDKTTNQDTEKVVKEEKVEDMAVDEGAKTADNAEKSAENVEEKKVDVNEEKKVDVKEEKMETDDIKEEVKETPEDGKEESKEATKDEESAKDATNDDKGIKEVELNIPSHLFRVGWSTVSSNMQLGEDKISYGLESSGKFFVNSEFSEKECKFAVGDVIGAYLDMGDDIIKMTYTKNGEIMFAEEIKRSEIEEEDLTLYPHILTRNYSFAMNVGNLEEPWCPCAEELKEYIYLNKFDEKVLGPQRPEKRSECQVIMMVGLPASGKTHWIKEHVKESDKKFTILGNNLLSRMAVDGKPIETQLNKSRWNLILDKISKCLHKICEIAALRRRNFIIDQTNVFPSAQRRKMRSFWDFKRRAVIVVNEDEEQAKRLNQKESVTGKEMPESAILEMKASMNVPRTGEWLDEITFASLPEDKAKAQVQKYNKEGRDAGFGKIQHRKDYRDDRSYNRWGGGGHGGPPRRDYRSGGNFRDNRSYHNNRFGDRGYRQSNVGGGWRSGGGGGSGGPAAGGWARNDRRENRGPRDWRSNNRVERPHRPQNVRDPRSHGGSGSGGGGGGGNYNRSRSSGGSGGSRNPGNNWGNQQQQVSSWGHQNSQSGGGGGGIWSSSQGGGQIQGSWGGQQQQQQQQGWNQAPGSWNQNQWKYGGYGQGGYGQYANWNYYGQYAQNWNSQGQTTGQATAVNTGTTPTNSSSDSQQYTTSNTTQMASQQAAWAQYAQQYANQSTGSSNQVQKMN
ncbi:PREDICTED: heterogeneous nuclear ribonucleoprotein U-like protein 1 isoform X2 [Nicrophorus vespilloides]|uniref:Heterogeneous nuclear ribonucleoprotein U-like protein 1 isoform X2 n=1 Tax=Nicrophorus vespilloides TaxID=110193 RepID=A0ABM1M6P3_NICVS|nr:PREDICTED: heterogeneous nuclear ribonucleoprotein U-like protein 1 isoform X2 [Nicrophorus vespilloides]